MSADSNTDCTNRSEHHLHICQLQRRGMNAEVVTRCDDPGYLCHNCNASANRAEDLCNPSPLARREGKGT